MLLLSDLIIGGRPVAFYPYEHNVKDRIIRVDYLSENLPEEQYRSIERVLVEKFRQAGINCPSEGNKIVFEVRFANHNIFIGFYDWVLSIGLDVRKVGGGKIEPIYPWRQ